MSAEDTRIFINNLLADLCANQHDWFRSIADLETAKPKSFQFLIDELRDEFSIDVPRPDAIVNFQRKGQISKNQKIREYLSLLWLKKNDPSIPYDKSIIITGNDLYYWRKFVEKKNYDLEEAAKEMLDAYALHPETEKKWKVNPKVITSPMLKSNSLRSFPDKRITG